MTIRLVDTHCHIQHEKYKSEIEIDEIICRAKDKMDFLIVSGANAIWNRQAIEISKKYPNFAYATAGVHPVYCKSISDVEFESEFQYIKENVNNIIGIGETGLDYHWDTDENILNVQKQRFEKLIELSKILKLPIVIHSRKAESDATDLLESHDAKSVVMHCFTGKKDIMNRCIDLGYYISFSTMIAKSKSLKKLAKACPIENILLETDSPYLSPFEEINFPWNVEVALKKISEVKNINEIELSNQIYENALRAFKL